MPRRGRKIIAGKVENVERQEREDELAELELVLRHEWRCRDAQVPSCGYEPDDDWFVDDEDE